MYCDLLMSIIVIKCLFIAYIIRGYRVTIIAIYRGPRFPGEPIHSLNCTRNPRAYIAIYSIFIDDYNIYRLQYILHNVKYFREIIFAHRRKNNTPTYYRADAVSPPSWDPALLQSLAH